MMAYAAARYRTGGSPLLVSVLASQMLPPIVLVLPLFMLFTTVLPVGGHSAIVLAHVAVNLPFMAWMLVSFFEGESRSLEEAARVDGARALAGVRQDHRADRSARHSRRGAARLRAELERVPLRADPERLVPSQTLPVGLASLETHAGVNIAPLAAATLLALAPVLVLLPLPAQIPDQGALPRSAQVSSQARRSDDDEEAALFAVA